MVSISTINNARILLTGITGYIGSQIIKDLINWKIINNLNISFVAITRDVEKAKKVYEGNDITYICTDICNDKQMQAQMYIMQEKGIDYIIHCAAPTKSSFMIANPIETVDSISIGTKNILEIARRLKVKSMVYLSSMEVYGNLKCVDENGDYTRITEEQLGDLDITKIRSCYPLGKRMAEYYCYAYYSEHGVPVKVARLAQTFGKGVQPDDNRVYAQFAHSVIENKSIILHTDGSSIGNYVDIEDAVDAILTILFKGENGEAYNVVNESNTMSIREMAELVAYEIGEGKIKVCYDIPQTDLYGYAAPTGLR